ncbi:MAG: MlaD family protein [Marinilabiliaceae bacterium]
MKNQSRKIRLGIFVIVSSALLLFLIIYFTAKELFEKSDTYYVAYQDESVSGMEVGSPVKYLGIKVGTISDIQIDPDDVTTIVVELSLDHETPIKDDSKADIVSLGITGQKAIEIHGGSNEADVLKPGSNIPPGSSLSSEISGKAEVIAEKVEKVLNNLQVFTHPDTLSKFTRTLDNFSRLADNADQTILKLDTIISDNEEDFRSTMVKANEISESLLASSHNIEKTVTQFESLAGNDSIQDIISNTREVTQTLKETDFSQLIEDLAETAKRTHELLTKIDNDINKSGQSIVESQKLLRSTLRNLDEASRKINNNPSVLIRKTKVKNLPDEKLKN